MRIRPARLVVATAFVLAAACTYDDFYGGGRAAYAGGYYGSQGVGGTGANDLDPWLRDTPEGQRLVLVRFDHNRNGEIGSDRAGEANRWFRRFADKDRDLKLTDAEIARGLRDLGSRLRSSPIHPD
jgi:hypothetical protein